MSKGTKKTAGYSNILVVAPHAWPDDDELTKEIGGQVAVSLNARAIINDQFRKPKKVKDDSTGQEVEEKPDVGKRIVNAGRIDQAKNLVNDRFYQPILDEVEEIKETFGKALVVWVHGMTDDHIKREASSMGLNEDLHMLIGIGQGQPDSFTAREETAKKLIDLLKQNEEQPVTARLALPGSKYCGWHQNIINQMFVQEGYKLSEVESIQLEIRMGGFRDSEENVAMTSKVLVKALGELAESLLPVRKVRLEDIQLETDADRKYIFRAVSDDAEVSKAQEAEIRALAHSIDKDGLVHPLVLIENGNGKYRILCGFRRFHALKLLKRKRLDARIYKEEDLTEEERIRISLAENARRKNLNPIEIGMFLQAARQNGKGKRTYKSLGKEFGEMLGIGTSHSSVQKYVKLDEIRVKGESQEMINDVLKGQLAFGTAAEVLAFIDDANDRNTLYSQIVEPMKPTKPELGDIKKWLEVLRNGNGLKSALAREDVKKAIEKANKSEHKSQEFIKLLKLLGDDPLAKQKQGFEEAVEALRKKVYGENATKEDFDIVPPADMEKNEVTAQFKLTPKGLEPAAEKAQQVLKDQQLKQLLDTIESP